MKMNLTRSAKGWSMPPGPTRFGPRRPWMKPSTRRSSTRKRTASVDADADSGAEVDGVQPAEQVEEEEKQREPAARSGTGDPSARRTVRVAAGLAGPIHLRLTDVVMPGLSGSRLAGRLAPQRPGLKVLYMSGYTEQSAAHKVGLDRRLPFVQKPFTAAEFLRQVRETLDR